jgi:hypothetical protein
VISEAERTEDLLGANRSSRAEEKSCNAQ